ncbi:MAG: DUF1735 domain-containing protein, partial [Bacteroidales bacterium]|nr:DUF1735 domain-containing protein [Bacteroidales bacterium]
MKRFIYLAAAVLCALSTSSCYEDYINDYKNSATYFASQKPLRTVIADRDMTIKIGAVIAGKREVDVNDFAHFTIDPDLVPDGKLIMPSEYYTLSDNNTMKVGKSNIPLMEVTVSFTQAFYNDPDAVGAKYVIPLRITDSSLDSILTGKEATVVAVKYISA